MNNPKSSHTLSTAHQSHTKSPLKTVRRVGGLVAGLLLTLVLTSTSQAQIAYDVGQISYESELAAPAYASFASGYEVQNSYEPWTDVSPQQSYAPQTYSALPTAPGATLPVSVGPTGNVQAGLAQQKAEQAAQMGMKGHIGGGLGGAKYEGVGWSNHSAQNAIRSCCYWGTRPTAQIGVTKGNDGFWYACVLYY